MKFAKQASTLSSKLFASSVGVAIICIVFAAAVGAWRQKKTEKFTDCSMSATCTLGQ